MSLGTRAHAKRSSGTPQLVWLSAVTWDFPLVGRTRMLTEELLAGGHSTTFVQVPSYRTALQRLGSRRTHPCVIRPWPLWQPMSRWAGMEGSDIERAVSGAARRLRRELSERMDVASAVAMVVSPIWAPWLEHLGFRTIVYDCIDDVEVMTPRAGLSPLYRQWEEELLDRSAAVVFASGTLRDRYRERCAATPSMVIPNGVDAGMFQRVARDSPRPADLPMSGVRPLVGFVGALYDWVDAELVGDVAGRLPDFDFLFVGPEQSAVPFPRRANIHYLGHRPHAHVPAYIQACDLCWLPFRDNAVTRAADPVKLYEYLSLGKPVVSSKALDPTAFDRLVQVGEDAESMARLLRTAVPSTPPEDRRRMEFAARNTWARRAEELVGFVGELAVELAGDVTGDVTGDGSSTVA